MFDYAEALNAQTGAEDKATFKYEPPRVEVGEDADWDAEEGMSSKAEEDAPRSTQKKAFSSELETLKSTLQLGSVDEFMSDDEDAPTPQLVGASAKPQTTTPPKTQDTSGDADEESWD